MHRLWTVGAGRLFDQTGSRRPGSWSSGFDAFEYAKQAIQMNVVEYGTRKPINAR